MKKDYKLMMPEYSFEERLETLKKLISEAKHIAFFGGAGVSTESGIPDFRSKNGLYNQHDVQFDKYEPEYLLSHSCLYNEPKVFYEFYRQKLNCEGIQPNITHKYLAKLEETGKRVSVITQNIDGLHQKAGSKEVYEIHGTTLKNYCTKCGKEFPADAIFKSEEAIPRCPDCKGVGFIRPAVTLYEEKLPVAFTEAVLALHKADLMIVAGTSLMVYPACTLISEYYGDNLVIINNTETDKDKFANLIFHENLGDVFTRL